MNAHVRPDLAPGIYPDIPNEAYHAGPGISKSGLWTIHSQSPAHYKYGEREQSNAFDFGEGCHLAVLQPNLFEERVMRGPDDRRGNKWKDAAEYCASEGKLLLTSGDFEGVLAIRDTVHANPFLNNLITSGQPEIEASGYWIDPATGKLCRCRPDLYRRDIKIMLDVKSCASAHPDAFAKAVISYGYHAQEAHYSDGFRTLDREVEGFVFLAFEKKPPYAFAVYELPPSIVEEGRAIIRNAMQTYAACEATGNWPGYGDGVRELSFKKWAYNLTEAPFEEGEAA